MNKIELMVADVHSTAMPSEAFSLILKEKEGNRYVPVVIGMSEARAILLELHNAPVHRPLSHELFVQLMNQSQCSLVRVDIVKYGNGVYYADIQFLKADGALFILDARPSDAIALALRCNAPFFMNEDIFNANCLVDKEGEEADEVDEVFDFEAAAGEETNEEIFIDEPSDEEIDFIVEFLEQNERKSIDKLSSGELEWLLNQAVEEENYELAARIKEELEKR